MRDRGSYHEPGPPSEQKNHSNNGHDEYETYVGDEVIYGRDSTVRYMVLDAAKDDPRMSDSNNE